MLWDAGLLARGDRVSVEDKERRAVLRLRTPGIDPLYILTYDIGAQSR